MPEECYRFYSLYSAYFSFFFKHLLYSCKLYMNFGIAYLTLPEFTLYS